MSDPTLDTLWQNVMVSWTDDAAHTMFIARCHSEGQLGFAASRYREEVRRSSVYRNEGERAEKAQKRLLSIAALALLDLHASRTPAAHRSGFAQHLARWALAMLLTGALAILALNLMALGARH